MGVMRQNNVEYVDGGPKVMPMVVLSFQVVIPVRD